MAKKKKERELNCICLKVIWKLVQLSLVKFQISSPVRRIIHTSGKLCDHRERTVLMQVR